MCVYVCYVSGFIAHDRLSTQIEQMLSILLIIMTNINCVCVNSLDSLGEEYSHHSFEWFPTQRTFGYG